MSSRTNDVCFLRGILNPKNYFAMTLYSAYSEHLPSKLSSLSVSTAYSLISGWTRGSLHFASFQAEHVHIRVAPI